MYGLVLLFILEKVSHLWLCYDAGWGCAPAPTADLQPLMTPIYTSGFSGRIFPTHRIDTYENSNSACCASFLVGSVPALESSHFLALSRNALGPWPTLLTQSGGLPVVTWAGLHKALRGHTTSHLKCNYISSQTVTHPVTNIVKCCLTSVFKWELG